MDSIIELLLEHFFPFSELHGGFDLAHHWIGTIVATCFEAFSHGLLELLSNLSISVTVEDSPCLESRLSEHLSLNLAVNFTHALFDVKAVCASTSIWSHEEFTSVEL